MLERRRIEIAEKKARADQRGEETRETVEVKQETLRACARLGRWAKC
jgi:hypothetical protein